jgi:hypothetical protein
MYYGEISDERRAEKGDKELIAFHVTVEDINGLWYGWRYDDDEREHFVAQGETYEEAMKNCHLRLQQQNPSLVVVSTYGVKKDATVQSQRECNVSQ